VNDQSSSALPATTEPRGFALYVGLDEAAAAADGVSLNIIVDALRRSRPADAISMSSASPSRSRVPSRAPSSRRRVAIRASA
jgi:hypothetical protein